MAVPERTANQMSLPDGAIASLVREMRQARDTHGPYATAHELYAVLLEEVDEFWDSVKTDTPDAYELLQVAAVAFRGYIQLTEGPGYEV